MTDRPAPRLPRANPAPRRALPRVKPLGAGGSLPDPDHDAPTSAPAADARPQSIVHDEPTGRDLLIPNGSEQARRKSRGSATVPSLAELMPPPGQPGAPRTSHEGRHDPALPKVKHGGGKGKHHEHGKGALAGPAALAALGPAGPAGPASKDAEPPKVVELQVILGKGLRKRLKAKAAELGLSPEEAVAQLVEVWVDG